MRNYQQILEKRKEDEQLRLTASINSFRSYISSEIDYSFDEKLMCAFIPSKQLYQGRKLHTVAEVTVLAECEEYGWHVQRYGNGWLFIPNELSQEQREKIYEALLPAPVYE